MRIMISIPDEMCTDVENLAVELGISRGELFRRAIREYVTRHSPDRLTEAMNSVIEKVGAGIDEFSHRATYRALGQVDW